MRRNRAVGPLMDPSSLGHRPRPRRQPRPMARDAISGDGWSTSANERSCRVAGTSTGTPPAGGATSSAGVGPHDGGRSTDLDPICSRAAHTHSIFDANFSNRRLPPLS